MMAKDMKMLTFFVKLFKTADDPGTSSWRQIILKRSLKIGLQDFGANLKDFTKRILRQKYLNHVGLDCLNSKQEELFEKSITEAFQNYDEISVESDSDDDFKKKIYGLNKRKLNSKSQGIKKAKTVSSDDENSSDNFKSNKLMNKNRNKRDCIENIEPVNKKIDYSSSKDNELLIKISNSSPEKNEDPGNETSPSKHSEKSESKFESKSNENDFALEKREKKKNSKVDSTKPIKDENSDSDTDEKKTANESNDNDFFVKKTKKNKMSKFKKVTSTKDDNSDTETDEKKFTNKKSSKKGSSEEKVDSDVEKMKGYIRAAGIRISNYQKVFEDCFSKKSKLEKLHGVLKDAGLKGRPSIKACQSLRKKRETAKEVAELDLGNILENKSGRTRGSMESDKTVKRNDVTVETKENVFLGSKNVFDSD